MYILELFTAVGYLHKAAFKNRLEINFAKCICVIYHIFIEADVTYQRLD